MPALKGAKTVGAGFDNAVEVVRVVYDFSVDGGQVEDNTLFTADGALLVRCIGTLVETAFTSGGSATIDLGVGTSGVQFNSATAVASYSANALVASATNAFVRMASGDVMNMGVAVAALTAGKCEFIFEICQA